jgi:hypothetical protein
MQTETKTWYQNQINNCGAELKILKRKSLFLSINRLVVFLTAAVLAYWFFGNTAAFMGTLATSIVLFLVLLSYYTNTKGKYQYWLKKKEILDLEYVFLCENKQPFADGEKFKDSQHFFSADIDLFGPFSLFQYLNRTTILEGEKLLAESLLSNDIEDVIEKQKAINELSESAEWRLNFTAKAAMVDQKIKHQVVFDWLESYQAFIPKLIKYLAYVLVFANAILFGLYAFDFITIYPIVVSFFVGLLISTRYVKRINQSSMHLSELKDVFTHYAGLLSDIETKEFKSGFCQDKKQLLGEKNDLASAKIEAFSGFLSALDQRNNILFAVLGNGFLLWDCQQVYKIEKWISSNSHAVKNWFDTIAWFDAQNSLANFRFNNPQFINPQVDEKGAVLIEAEQLGHFFIDEAKRVTNDFIIDKQHFTIITGANMAGKSTFLRTVAISIVCANVGLPVCAKSFLYKPIKLVTSMRNTDSLHDESSYFFAELSRLKMIVDAVQSEAYFVILDEILKGTNSKDKEEGSIKLMKKLSATKATGLIATHDLGLCNIEKSISTIKNQYFDAEIVNDELYFDYKLKNGVCQNMNASFLLHKMQIV